MANAVSNAWARTLGRCEVDAPLAAHLAWARFAELVLDFIGSQDRTSTVLYGRSRPHPLNDRSSIGLNGSGILELKR
jgi:hypothetical protein